MQRWCRNYDETLLYTIGRHQTTAKLVIKPMSCNKTHQLHSCELDECTASGSASQQSPRYSQKRHLYIFSDVIYGYMN